MVVGVADRFADPVDDEGSRGLIRIADSEVDDIASGFDGFAFVSIDLDEEVRGELVKAVRSPVCHRDFIHDSQLPCRFSIAGQLAVLGRRTWSLCLKACLRSLFQSRARKEAWLATINNPEKYAPLRSRLGWSPPFYTASYDPMSKLSRN